MFCAAGLQLPALVEAYRTGGGVGWAAFGTDMRESQADMNRPWFERALPGALGGVPDLDAALRRPCVRIADIGSGGGWSTIALARAYPQATVDGFDVDPPSIDLARRNAAEAGVADWASFHQADGAALGEGGYDAAFAFECIHDLPRPVDVLAASACSSACPMAWRTNRQPAPEPSCAPTSCGSTPSRPGSRTSRRFRSPTSDSGASTGWSTEDGDRRMRC